MTPAIDILVERLHDMQQRAARIANDFPDVAALMQEAGSGLGKLAERLQRAAQAMPTMEPVSEPSPAHYRFQVTVRCSAAVKIFTTW